MPKNEGADSEIGFVWRTGAERPHARLARGPGNPHGWQRQARACRWVNLWHPASPPAGRRIGFVLHKAAGQERENPRSCPQNVGAGREIGFVWRRGAGRLRARLARGPGNPHGWQRQARACRWVNHWPTAPAPAGGQIGFVWHKRAGQKRENPRSCPKNVGADSGIGFVWRTRVERLRASGVPVASSRPRRWKPKRAAGSSRTGKPLPCECGLGIRFICLSLACRRHPSGRTASAGPTSRPDPGRNRTLLPAALSI